MILLSELSRRRIRSIQKLIRVGRNEVVVVLRVDREKGESSIISPPGYPASDCCPSKGYIDLSKRRVSPEDIIKCEERFMKSKTVASILRHVASKLSGEEVGRQGGGATSPKPDAAPADDEEGVAQTRNAGEEAKLESLYEQVAWPLGKIYGHPYDAFKLALTEPDKVFSQLSPAPSPTTIAQLTATIARRLTPQPIKLRADIELTCYTEKGIDAIKRALKAGEATGSEDVPIKAKLVAPPLYVLGTNATDKVRLILSKGFKFCADSLIVCCD